MIPPEFLNADQSQKIRSLGLYMLAQWKNFDDQLSRFDTIADRHRQTEIKMTRIYFLTNFYTLHAALNKLNALVDDVETLTAFQLQTLTYFLI